MKPHDYTGRSKQGRGKRRPYTVVPGHRVAPLPHHHAIPAPHGVESYSQGGRMRLRASQSLPTSGVCGA